MTSTDILYVPGGPARVPLESDERFLAHLRALDATSTWTVGICNGVALLAAAGMLKGRKATTNWSISIGSPSSAPSSCPCATTATAST